MGEATSKVPSSAAFSRSAGAYDAARRRLVPCFDAFYGAAVQLVGEYAPRPSFRALDLGAGTGLLSALIRARFPRARLHLVDASAAMLDQAVGRFNDDGLVSFEVGDMATVDLCGPWDIVVSALAIHHLEHADKQALLRRVGAALTPGGLFVNAEQVLGPDPEAESHYAKQWLEEVRALGATADEIQDAEARMAHDRCATMEEQLGWMRAVGLVQVDCVFKSWRFAVLSGRKAAAPAAA